jgi:amidase
MTSAVDLRAMLAEGRLSATDVADEFLSTVGDDDLHAWGAIDGERLRAQAAQLDATEPEGRRRMPLFGVPVAIKDNIDTFDLPTTYGSVIYAGQQPAADTALVSRLRAAGALIAGKTKCAEFAWMSPPDTLNPLDRERTPGGSSSGSAAAVAAGHVPLALGTQTAGSVNRPASYCGVIGYTPSFERYPRAGLKLMSERLDTVGVFARSIPDLQLFDRAVHIGQSVGRPMPAGELSIGFAPTPFWDLIDAGAAAAISNWLDRARAEGRVTDRPVEIPGYERLARAQETIQQYESAQSLAPEMASTPGQLSDALRAALSRGAEIPDSSYAAAIGEATSLAQDVAQALNRYDAVLTPSALGVPPRGLAFTGDPIMSRAWTLLHAPSLSLPLVWTTDGLPVGLQVVAAPGRDEQVQAAAAYLMEGGLAAQSA